MKDSPIASIETHFSSLADPRAEHSINHRLIDIVMITICAVICGADNWVEIENYGYEKLEWLQQFLELPHGIPSHDTLMRFYEDVVQLFQFARQQNWHNTEHKFYQTINKGHGRLEIRRHWTMGQTEYLSGSEQWKGLQTIGLVESERRVNHQTTIEQRYYLLSIPSDAQRFAEAVRSHWSIENQLHWILDVGFLEDSVKGCLGYSAENLAVVRHLAINLLTHEHTAKVGIHAKRKKAGWNNNYLTCVLNSLSNST
jgi:predicted transposase YbfD/YdcC